MLATPEATLFGLPVLRAKCLSRFGDWNDALLRRAAQALMDGEAPRPLAHQPFVPDGRLRAKRRQEPPETLPLVASAHQREDAPHHKEVKATPTPLPAPGRP